MVCSTCKESGVLSSALGQSFYYCRGCKTEIQLETAQINRTETKHPDDFLGKLIRIDSPSGPFDARVYGYSPNSDLYYASTDYGDLVLSTHDIEMGWMRFFNDAAS